MSGIVRVNDAASFLASLDQAKAFLAACSSFDDAKQVRDKAEALRAWARARGDAEDLEIHAAELKVRATIRMGELAPEKIAPQEAGALGGRAKASGSPKEPLQTPAEKRLLHVTRAAASVPVAVREKIIESAKANHKAPTVAALVRESKRVEVVEKLEAVAAKHAITPTGIYDVVVVDPPWPIEKIERDVRPNQTSELDYPTMTLDEIEALKIPAADDAHLWLWTTHRFLQASFDVLAEWGFKYVCTFVWHKPGGFQPVGLPQFNCEFALYARKGSPSFIDTKALPVCFEAPRGKHGEKPEAFYDVVRRVTGGRRLDMFNRRKIEGFDAWGKEA